jgi:two-component system, chemotaxis family, CheB/CheR fusion protein
MAPVSGRASLNLIHMAREGIAGEMQSAIQEARDKNVRVTRSNAPVLNGETTSTVDIDVTPIQSVQTKERFFLVLFSSSPLTAGERPKTGSRPAVGKEAQVEQLRQDLQATRTYLQATIEKHEGINQELRAANEEIQSSNEELQSTNEELETAKEELQSTNEELTTVNEELHSRQLELIQLNNDLNNLINSVHLPIIILGQDMRIRRFTPMAEKVLNVIPTDIGRPLSDININLKVPNLQRLMTEVVDSLTMKEIEVQDNHGRWYAMRLRPYKTAENKIEGVVLTLIDIDEMKRTIEQLQEARNYAQAVIETSPEPRAVLTSDFKIKSANDSLAKLLGTTSERLLERSIFDVVRDHEGIREVRKRLEQVIPSGTSLTNFEVCVDLPGTGSTPLSISGRQIVTADRSYPLILLSLRTVSDAKQ